MVVAVRAARVAGWCAGHAKETTAKEEAPVVDVQRAATLLTFTKAIAVSACEDLRSERQFSDCLTMTNIGLTVFSGTPSLSQSRGCDAF
jgi:hypothetical protein